MRKNVNIATLLGKKDFNTYLLMGFSDPCVFFSYGTSGSCCFGFILSTYSTAFSLFLWDAVCSLMCLLVMQVFLQMVLVYELSVTYSASMSFVLFLEHLSHSDIAGVLSSDLYLWTLCHIFVIDVFVVFLENWHSFEVWWVPYAMWMARG